MKKGKLVWDDNSRTDLRKENKGIQFATQWKPENMNLEIWISKQGRGGKSVSVIKGLVDNKQELKSLSKALKNKFACGGTIKDLEIEVQNDNREKIKAFLETLKFKVKICGG